jgi:hypothetical protein
MSNNYNYLEPHPMAKKAVSEICGDDPRRQAWVSACVSEAIADERERCAMIAEKLSKSEMIPTDAQIGAGMVAKYIREQPEAAKTEE